MTRAPSTSRWIDGLFTDTPCVVAARVTLQLRLKSVERLLARSAHPSEDDPEYVHQLRVATRRSAAALRILGDFFRPKARRRVRRCLREVRRAASCAREDDVHAAILQRDAKVIPSDAQSGIQTVLEHIASERIRSQDEIVKAAGRCRVARVRRKLLRGLRIPRRPGRNRGAGFVPAPGERPYTLIALAGLELPPLIRSFRSACDADLVDGDALHNLRIAGKRLRYSLEVLACCFPSGFKETTYRTLCDMQDRLGEINDCREIAERVNECITKFEKSRGHCARNNGSDRNKTSETLASLGQFYRKRYEQSVDAFLVWFDIKRRNKLLAGLAALVPSRVSALSLKSPDSGGSERKAEGTDGNAPGQAKSRVVTGAATGLHRRVAAIDVGTNSIRLAVAETDPATGFRVIEDLKETTRLGSGVFNSGRLKVGAVKRSLTALERMRDISAGYHVERLRAVATSAVREASNGRKFIKLVRRRAHVPIEIIEAPREARLAFSGVARDFDLLERRVAVVDTGGGSTELVFASSGMIDTIRPLTLGAVRLTEMFSASNEPGRYRFDDMSRWIDRVLRKSIRRLPYRPEFIIGAGGTFTSLARVAIRRGMGANQAGRFPFAIRGFELGLETVAELLQWLRRMSLDDRRRVPGLSSQRAEIIVAGLCIVERLMDYLRVDRLLVHDGGIRDGLLGEMIDEIGVQCAAPRTHPRQLLRAVQRFAERMDFDRSHCEHVARLSLRIFDDLSAQDPDSSGTWARKVYRDLLESAALLHEIGRRVGKKNHHRHAYDMIVHGDLATLTRREIEIIANTCRYHTGRAPRRRDYGLRKLGSDDQRLVAHLAGILRIAEGLDSGRKGRVTGIRVRTDGAETCFGVSAEGDATSDVKRAQRKADVFETAFRTRARLFLNQNAGVVATN